MGNELASGPTTLTIRDVLDLLKYAFILKVSHSDGFSPKKDSISSMAIGIHTRSVTGN